MHWGSAPLLPPLISSLPSFVLPCRTARSSVCLFPTSSRNSSVQPLGFNSPSSVRLGQPRKVTQRWSLNGTQIVQERQPEVRGRWGRHIVLAAGMGAGQEQQVLWADWWESGLRPWLALIDLAGVAPLGARWTCLQLDLHDIISVYLNRHYSHLKSIRLCASLLVRSLYTSDLCFDPGKSWASCPVPGLSAGCSRFFAQEGPWHLKLPVPCCL